MTRLEEIRAEIARLEAEAKELGAQKWVVDDVGVSYKYNEFNQHSLSRYEAQGRVFDTQAEAEWFAKFERAQAKLRSLSDIKATKLSNWDDRKYFWYLSVAADCWRLDSAYAYIPGVVWFENSEAARTAIKEMASQMDDLKPFKGV